MNSNDESDLAALKAAVERSIKRFSQELDEEASKSAAYFERFDKHISNEDLTGVLIRGHLYAETEMAKILANAVPLYDKIPSGQLMFEAKVAWLRAFAIISSDERKTLQALNKIRNKLAHITKPGTVPELSTKQINDLRDTLAPSMLEVTDPNEHNSTDAAVVLRSSILAIVITLHIRAEVTEGQFGVSDVARYHLTGETVQQRVDAARKLSERDNAELKAAKEAVSKLRDDDRDALRIWMREIYHY